MTLRVYQAARRQRSDDYQERRGRRAPAALQRMESIKQVQMQAQQWELTS